MEEVEIYNKLTHLQWEGIVGEYFSNLLVFPTYVQDVLEERILQISICGILKQSIQNEIKLLDVKYMEQARLKERLFEEKQKSQCLVVYIHPT